MKRISWSKIRDHLYSKIKILVCEKTFSSGEFRIRYIYEESKGSDDLIVIFSSCTREGIRARYNYMRTLREIRANKLFILDDFGFDCRGAYYLGKEKRFEIERNVEALIRHFIAQCNPSKKFFVGSSKGGYAALLFGSKFDEAAIICGSPLYALGTYLSRPVVSVTYKYIMGSDSEENISYLDHYLKNALESSPFIKKAGIHVLYSDHEVLHPDHFVPLFEDLTRLGCKINAEVENYEDHNQVSKFFPHFMLRALKNEIA